MTEESILRARQNCCRLCLAPDSECVPIFNSFAADKEPLALKIQTCVNIKITQNDRLSSRICHACISYLNSWQSFKNRCLASQNKQRAWLGSGNRTVESGPKTGTKLATNSKYPTPIKIKDEPIDDDLKSDQEGIDPTQFLESMNGADGTKSQQDSGEGGEASRQPPPQILASLGLTSTGVNPFSFLSTELHDENQSDMNDSSMLGTPDTTLDSFNGSATGTNVEAACRVCSLKFSTRANARRHERNLHPQLFVPQLPNVTIQAVPKSFSTPVTQQKRPTTKDAITPEMLGIYEYDKPEKYRHLLTEEKAAFFQLHEEFIKQYQDMTCFCCSKTYATYKIFMAHMRKKYPNLPRNLCFKCLKQCDSKALFISHLKKRNCINLYKIFKPEYAAGESSKHSSPVDLRPNLSHAERYRAKELLANKIYECKICNKPYHLKLEFRSHVYDEHSDYQKKDVKPGHCGFCGLHIADPFERKRHYNNMDCIVFLKCTACNEKFDKNQTFLDHIYAKHLANNNDAQKSSYMSKDVGSNSNANQKDSPEMSKPLFSSRMPQSCTICGQTYNNYNNVLRHMESKHPDQMPETYKCMHCESGFPRLTNLKDHVMQAHNLKVEKYRRNSAGGTEIVLDFPAALANKSTDGSKQPYTGRYEYVMKDLLSITNGTVDNGQVEDDADGSPATKKVKLEGNESVECHICLASFSNRIGLANHMRSHPPEEQNASNDLKFPVPAGVTNLTHGEQRFRRMRCRICQKRFSSKKGYRRHMLVEHAESNIQFITCKLCNAEFAYEKGLKVHMFKVHNTVLKDEFIEKQYECDICSIVYRTDEQLQYHRSTVHTSELRQMEEEMQADKTTEDSSVTWYQCRYCPSNFNTNKKLAIHINSHDEFDSNDYSCKDCGNVYSGRKSLWVHRYKKHPPVADPSQCELCLKTFFDKAMLELHTPNCVKQSPSNARKPFKHQTGDDEDENENENDDMGQSPSFHMPKMPEVACTICDKKFSDQDLFVKHIEIHEKEMYTDNPLAAMFDAGGETSTKSYLDPVNESGEYSCDICAKTFPMLSSLKVHRNWHFRNDSKSTTTESSSQPPPRKRKRTPLKCEYCQSFFQSSNNLKRHIAEIHRSELDGWVEPPKIEPEKHLQCTKCDIKFENRRQWVEHKIEEAKVAKPFAPFEWGCEICGRYLSRKERLIHHMMSHIKERTVADVDPNGADFEENSRDSRNENDDDENQEMGDEEEEEEDEEDNDEIVDEDQKPDEDPIKAITEDDESHDETSSSDSESDSDSDDGDASSSDHERKTFSCDLCQVVCLNSQELQKHVTSHFLNGPGSVTLTEVPKSKSKSVESSEDSDKQELDNVVTITPI